MEREKLLALLGQVQNGEVSPEEALSRLRLAPFEDSGYAKVDHHRALRQGAAEVIYGRSKTPEQILGIAKSMICLLYTSYSVKSSGAEMAVISS